MSIFYIPEKKETGTMWDTWLYWHEGRYYLYYLANYGPRPPWDNISMAVSDDGVHWNELGLILKMSEGAAGMGTGSTWKSPDPTRGKKFQINYSEGKNLRQQIMFAKSDDLVHWTKLGEKQAFVSDERWYERNRWDCIWTIPNPNGGLYGYWTANPKLETRGRFGFGQTLDGIKWEVLPPPEVHMTHEGEVGAIEKIGSRYYMMYGCHFDMYTLVADKPEGPFHPAKKNHQVLAGETYFSRFFPTPDGLLVTHFSLTPNGKRYLGLLKRATVDDEGILRLSWWEGNDLLKQDRTEMEITTIQNRQVAVQMLDPVNMAEGIIVEGDIVLPADPFAPRRGLYIEYESGQGQAVLFDAQGRAELSLMKQNGETCQVKSRVDREMVFKSPAQWRMVMENYLVELYLNDILIQCFSLPASATGRIGLITGREPDAIRNLRVWQ